MLRLLPMTDRDKDAEILALPHQITVLERQLGKDKIRYTPSDRAFLAALLHGCRCTSYEDHGCSYAPTRCCVGTATSSHAAMPPPATDRKSTRMHSSHTDI